jgi:cardiolipin synthase
MHTLPALHGGHGEGAARDAADADRADAADGAGPRVFQAGRVAFAAILRRVAEAEHSIEVRAFLWRDDDAGNQLGQALLAAADRGVAVRIRKDRIAAVYEYTGGNKQSFFHKRVSPLQGFQAWFLGAVYRAPGSFRQRPSALAEAMLRHPNIEVSHERKRFDHSKLFVFDERIVTLGSMGIGDNHHRDWVDVMVEIQGRAHVDRLRQRLQGAARFDPGRTIDFLVHSRASAPRRSCAMLLDRLAVIEAAQRSLTVEMAYLGDGRFTGALVRAVRRGVQVKLVTSAMADVLGNLNRATCDTLLARTGAPLNLTIVTLPRMVHAKIVVADGEVCDVGSANFTPLSHGVYDEIDLYAVSPGFGAAIERAVDEHCVEGEVVQGRLGYRRLHSQIERVIMAYQARKGGRLPRRLLAAPGHAAAGTGRGAIRMRRLLSRRREPRKGSNFEGERS